MSIVTAVFWLPAFEIAPSYCSAAHASLHRCFWLPTCETLASFCSAAHVKCHCCFWFPACETSASFCSAAHVNFSPLFLLAIVNNSPPCCSAAHVVYHSCFWLAAGVFLVLSACGKDNQLCVLVFVVTHMRGLCCAGGKFHLPGGEKAGLELSTYPSAGPLQRENY